MSQDLTLNIGMKVCKPSGKPFKSTFKVNTIKGVIEHPQTKRAAYTFEEDDSYVDACKCKVVPATTPRI